MFFGSLRYVLAVLVVMGHLMGRHSVLGWHAATYAVFTFYMLSGYLMTFILKEVYKYSFVPYIKNRIIRIYSSYYLYFVLGLVCMMVVPKLASGLHPNMMIPHSLEAWIRNLTIVGLDSFVGKDMLGVKGYCYSVRVLPASWAVGLEMIFYIAMFWLSKTNKRIGTWLVISVAITAFSIISGVSFPQRYFSVHHVSLPFAAGSALYLMMSKNMWFALLIKKNARLLALVGFLLYIFNIKYAARYGNVFMQGFYFNLVISFILLGCLTSIANVLPVYMRKIDKFLGDLSYPIYLSHWIFASIVSDVIFNGLSRSDGPQSKKLFWGTLILMHAVVIPLTLFLDRKIEHIRDAIRGKRIEYERFSLIK